MAADRDSFASEDHGVPGEMVDWQLAVSTAKRLMRPGPEVSRDQARRTVDELRRVRGPG